MAGGDASTVWLLKTAPQAKLKATPLSPLPTPPPTLRSRPGRRHKIVASLVMCWLVWQAFLPYSHFVTKGYNTWVKGLYGYSWDMMIKGWATQHVRITFVTKDTNETGYLDPEALTYPFRDRWQSHPDMIVQFGRCVQRRLRQFNITDFALYIDVWRSMTKRFQQRQFDPNVDILTADWSPFRESSWVMPLLSELTDWRSKFEQVKDSLSNEAEEGRTLTPDVVFAADFPGMYLENFIHADFDNATLEVMNGTVVVEFLGPGEEEEEGMILGGESEEEIAWREKKRAPSAEAERGVNVTLLPGMRLRLPPGEYNRIHTIGPEPSCYMFIYENGTENQEYAKDFVVNKMYEKMKNDSTDNPGKRNFTIKSEVAEFLNLNVNSPNVTHLTERWSKRVEKEKDIKVESGGNTIMDRINQKIQKHSHRYGKGILMAYYAFESIWRGIPMEDLMEGKVNKLEAEESAAKAAERAADAAEAAENATEGNTHRNGGDETALTHNDNGAIKESDLDADYAAPVTVDDEDRKRP